MARQTTSDRFNIDAAHKGLDVYSAGGMSGDIGAYDITYDVWNRKYRWGEEKHPFDSMTRVVEGVFAKDPSKEAKKAALEAMQKLLWVPAGRIQAGAGTPNVVTLLNCYVSRDIEDSMSGIADALKDGMLTMQQGGGDGFNFSTLRPKGAYLSRTGAEASGPLPFMTMWDSMCGTIMSAGGRRGAMMGVMDDTHPDLPEFIVAKHKQGVLTNFNVSVLISDAFMDALACDEDWYLGFNVPRKDEKHLFVTERETDDGEVELWYAYSKWRAKDLWDLIIKNTFEWSEPGVIFIDRINAWNNLNYCETITCTNPCGEQPLPPNGCCNLGAVNLAKMVTDPYGSEAAFDYDLLRQVAAVGTRFLDNVIDVTLYPLEDQAREEYAKRRIGVGITGLANCLAQLGIRYGSPEAIIKTDSIMCALADEVYYTSTLLAKERGTFPLYDASQWAAHSPVLAHLSLETKRLIKEHGVRNGVLLTIAPTGTTSLYAGNVSSGLEPVFQHKAQRNVRQDDDTFKPYTVYDFGYLLWCSVMGHRPDATHTLPDYMVGHDDLTVGEHIKMQATCQQYIDASVSKTINCPMDITFEEFQNIYMEAWNLGCKGCTTYKYSEVRGSILSVPTKGAESGPGPRSSELVTHEEIHLKRPDVLAGRTYKVKWPSVNENYYITINEVAERPFEVFIQSTSSKFADWTTALSLMISAIMRKGGDISFIPEELSKVKSAEDSGWVDGKYFGSLVALIGATIGKDFESRDLQRAKKAPSTKTKDTQAPIGEGAAAQQHTAAKLVITEQPPGDFCPQCGQPTVIRQEGCDRCQSCDFSRCG